MEETAAAATATTSTCDMKKLYVVDVTNATVPADPEDVSTERDALKQRLQSRVENAVFNALREAAGVQDNRSRYY